MSFHKLPNNLCYIRHYWEDPKTYKDLQAILCEIETKHAHEVACPLLRLADGVTTIWGRLTPADITQAIAENSLKLVYQPFIDLQTGSIVGYEALARLDGFTPDQVFAVVDEAEMSEVFVYLKKYANQAMALLGKPVYLNLSYVDLFRDPDYPFLEIPESHFIDANLSIVEALSKKYVVALDDIGKDYSAWQFVGLLPLRKLKLDKFFADQILGPAAEQYKFIIGFFVEYCKRFDLELLCEGVETIEQVNILKELGVQQGQGWYWHPGRPLDYWLTI